MKKIISLFLCFALTFGLLVPVAAAEPVATSDYPVTIHMRQAGGAQNLGPGDDFQMEVYINNPSFKSIGAISFLNIDFDTDILEWNPDIPFSPGFVSTDTQLRLIPPQTFEANRAFFSFASTNVNFTGSGVLMALNFRVRDDVGTVETFVNAGFAVPQQPPSTRGGAGITSFFGSEEVDYAFEIDPINVAVHALTVEDSHAAVTGAGDFAEGVFVTIHAGQQYEYLFTNWTSDPPVNFTNETAATTTFVMPGEPVTVTANWETDTRPEYLVTVVSEGASGVSGSGNFREGRTITINAGTRAGHMFNNWTIDYGDIVLDDEYSAVTTFIMPTEEVRVTANWIPSFGVTVNGSQAGTYSGAGTHMLGSPVTIVAGARANYTFNGWDFTGTGSVNMTEFDRMSPIIAFTMPNGAVTATATWMTTDTGSFSRTATWPPPGGNTTIAGHRNAPQATRSIWAGTGTSFAAVPNTAATNTSGGLASGTHLFGMTSAEHGNGVRTVIQVVLTANQITVSGRGHGGGWLGGNWGAVWNAISGADQSRLLINNAGTQFGVSWGTTIPSGWQEAGRHHPTSALTVNGSYAGGATGAARYREGNLAAVNAGHRPGYVFSHWTASPAVNFSDANSVITNFTMPASNVTVTAHWNEAPREIPTVNWPDNLTAQFGQTLINVSLPGNIGGTPGTFSWVGPLNTPVGDVGTALHYLRFTPENLAYFDIVEHEVGVNVLPARPSVLSLPSALPLPEGYALSSSNLVGGSTTGTWAWEDGTIVPPLGAAPQWVVFTPDDLVNFDWSGLLGWHPETETIRRQINVTVNPPVTVTIISEGAAGIEGAGTFIQGTSVEIYPGTRENYQFGGWVITEGPSLGQGFNEEHARTSFIMPGLNVVLTATWLRTFELTIISEGADGAIIISEGADGITGSGRFPEGTHVAVVAGTRRRHEFTAWDITEGGSVPGLSQHLQTASFLMPARDITLTAIWNELQFLDSDIAMGFIRIYSTPEAGWANGISNLNNFAGNDFRSFLPVEFDVTVNQYVRMTLPPWPGAGGPLHPDHAEIYLAQPTAAVSPERLQVGIAAIYIDGVATSFNAANNSHGAPGSRWFIAGTYGTINPVTVSSGGYATDAVSAFAARNLELRMFNIPRASFSIPGPGAVLEVVFRVGAGGEPGAPTRNLTILGGGTGATSSSPVPVGSTANIFAGTGSTGYSFGGWEIISGGPLDNFDPTLALSSFQMPDRDVVLQAHWIPPAFPAHYAATAWVFMQTGTGTGFNTIQSPQVEFDVSQHQDIVLTLPPFPAGGNGVLHADSDVYLAAPVLPGTSNLRGLPIVLHSVRVDGNHVHGPRTHAAPTAGVGGITFGNPGTRLLQWPMTIGTMNPVRIDGMHAPGNAAQWRGFFGGSLNLQLRTFNVSTGAFTVNTGQVVEFVFRVGNGGPTPVYRDVAITTSPSGLNVVGAYDGGEFRVGNRADIFAGTVDGYNFAGWTVLEGGPLTGGFIASNARTFFTMPDEDVILVSNWEPEPIQPVRRSVTIFTSPTGLDVTGTSGEGEFEAGETVEIYAGTAPSGYLFVGWTFSAEGDAVNLENFNPNHPRTSFIMPDTNISFTANWYRPTIQPGQHAVTISSAAIHFAGGGSFSENETVNIFAGLREGYTFTGWTVSPSAITLADSTYHTTFFTMPDEPVELIANWQFTPRTFRIGDVNGDGEVDEDDVELLTRFLLSHCRISFRIANPEFIYAAAKTAGNNYVTFRDLTLLRLYVAGLVDRLGPPEENQ